MSPILKNKILPRLIWLFLIVVVTLSLPAIYVYGRIYPPKW